MWLVLGTPPVPPWHTSPIQWLAPKVLCLRVWPLVSALPSLGAGKKGLGINQPRTYRSWCITTPAPSLLGRIPLRRVSIEAPTLPGEMETLVVPARDNTSFTGASFSRSSAPQQGLPCTFQANDSSQSLPLGDPKTVE